MPLGSRHPSCCTSRSFGWLALLGLWPALFAAMNSRSDTFREHRRTPLRTLAEFARTLVGRYAIADVLNQLTDRVVVALCLDGGGVSVADEHGNLRFATAAPDELISIEQAQQELQQGPCVSAFESGEVITANDLSRETRWPDYVPIAINKGYGAVVAIPLCAADGSIGSLNCYSRRPRAW